MGAAGGMVGAGMILNTYSTIRAGKNAMAQAKTQRRIYDWNAANLEREGRARVSAAKLEEQRVSRQGQVVQGRVRANIAKSGVSSQEGSPIDVLVENAERIYMDRALTLREGLLEKSELDNQAALLRHQGKLIEAAGKEKKKQLYLKAWADGLTMVGALSNTGAGATQPYSFGNGQGATGNLARNTTQSSYNTRNFTPQEWGR